jgi:hypothetical protein
MLLKKIAMIPLGNLIYFISISIANLFFKLSFKSLVLVPNSMDFPSPKDMNTSGFTINYGIF